MDVQALRREWLAEEQRGMRGWDFSHLASRWQEQPTSWDYGEIVRKYLRPVDRMLDMGTGGGEFLLSLGHPPDHTYVTEAWEPNIRLCMEKLAPMGITVCPVTDHSRLPIGEDWFNIVINRHEEYDLGEVSRVLCPGGMFITQQVGWKDCLSLAQRLCPGTEPEYKGFCLESELPKFLKNGFGVKRSEEEYLELRFLDVGAVVYFATVIEWTFPGFSVDSCFDRLLELQREINKSGYISTKQHRFVILAKNLKRWPS